MKFIEWIEDILNIGDILCAEYTEKVKHAVSKKQFVDIVLDANGIDWLQEMDDKGKSLPYEVILSEFKNYINGNYIATYGSIHKYTSALYCCYNESNKLEINTTLTSFLGCKLDVYINENDYVYLYCDKNCELTIHCPATSKCKIEYREGAKIFVENKHDKVILTKKAQ